MIDALLVGEDDRLVLVPPDRAFAVDPIELHEDFKSAGGHLSLLIRLLEDHELVRGQRHPDEHRAVGSALPTARCSSGCLWPRTSSWSSSRRMRRLRCPPALLKSS